MQQEDEEDQPFLQLDDQFPAQLLEEEGDEEKERRPPALVDVSLNISMDSERQGGDGLDVGEAGDGQAEKKTRKRKKGVSPHVNASISPLGRS